MKKRILLADDEKELLSISKRLLERLGYEVASSFTSARTAWDKLSEGEISLPDIILTDNDFGESIYNGYWLAVRVKALFPQIKVVMVSGSKQPDPLPEILDAFVSKPYGLENLTETLNELVA
ncbi:response regulator [Candidatus Berkelbacteria bacterium]|nr:response regulator [Candidatus Berkelbacteria bacterium]